MLDCCKRTNGRQPQRETGSWRMGGKAIILLQMDEQGYSLYCVGSGACQLSLYLNAPAGARASSAWDLHGAWMDLDGGSMGQRARFLRYEVDESSTQAPRSTRRHSFWVVHNCLNRKELKRSGSDDVDLVKFAEQVKPSCQDKVQIGTAPSMWSIVLLRNACFFQARSTSQKFSVAWSLYMMLTAAWGSWHPVSHLLLLLLLLHVPRSTAVKNVER